MNFSQQKFLRILQLEENSCPASSMAFFVYTALLSAIWVTWLIIYRLYFHPLAKFPGPKFAAVSFLYEFYWDGIKGGQYNNKIKKAA